MLRHRGVDLFHERADVETLVPLGLRLDRVVQREKAGTGRGLDVHAVEAHVQIEHPVLIRPRRRRGLRQVGVAPLERLHQQQPRANRQLRGEPPGQRLHRPHDVEQLPRILLRERRNGRPRLTPRVRAHDVAFLLEPLQRAPHRRTAHPEPRRDLRLDDPRARRQSTSHDQFAKLLVRPIDTLAPRHEARGRVIRPAAGTHDESGLRECLEARSP